MVPTVPSVLNGLARTLMMDLAPQVMQSPYAGQTLQLSAMLLMMGAQEFDRAAARLAEENDAVAAVFRAALPVVHDAALGGALECALAAAPPRLLVSALRERNQSLRALLIRLHAHLETVEGAAARAVEDRVWAELAESTQRRKLDLAIA